MESHNDRVTATFGPDAVLRRDLQMAEWLVSPFLHLVSLRRRTDSGDQDRPYRPRCVAVDICCD